MTSFGRQTGAGRWGIVAALVLALGAAGCDSLLDVNLPAAVTSDALNNPSVAGIRVGSVQALFECAYSTFSMDASGYEDNWQRVTGVAGNYSEYSNTASGGTCDTGVYNGNWIDAFLTARGMGYENHGKMLGWGSSNTLIATNAFYTAAILDIFGEYFCENAIDGGPLLTNSDMLDVAEGWADSVLKYASTDFAITTSTGTHSPSIRAAAYGLRSRIRWANGDLAGAAADGAMVPTNHMSYVLREEGEKRRNMIASMQGNGAPVATQAAGFLQGPVHVKGATDPYGISQLGNMPGGGAWPDPVPFTGYIGLAVETATGRLVDDNGNALTLATAGTEDDPRVTEAIGTVSGIGNDYIEAKYTNLADDIPLVNWREMRLIQAEAAGPGAAATALVNSVRPAGMPQIQGAYQTLVESDANAFRNMIIEERRRVLWLEGRFWSTKILNTDKLWFPRALGEWVNSSVFILGGGVRMLLPGDEYQINENFAAGGALALRGTGCDPDQAPVGF